MKEGEIPSRRLIGRGEEKEKVFDSYICKDFPLAILVSRWQANNLHHGELSPQALD